MLPGDQKRRLVSPTCVAGRPTARGAQAALCRGELGAADVAKPGGHSAVGWHQAFVSICARQRSWRL